MRPVGIPSCSTTLTWRDCGRRGSEKLKEQGKQSALGIHKYTETRIYYDFIFFLNQNLLLNGEQAGCLRVRIPFQIL